MKTVQTQLGERVRELRAARNWTQEELATRARKHPTYIGGIERGERNPTAGYSAVRGMWRLAWRWRMVPA